VYVHSLPISIAPVRTTDRLSEIELRPASFQESPKEEILHRFKTSSFAFSESQLEEFIFMYQKYYAIDLSLEAALERATQIVEFMQLVLSSECVARPEQASDTRKKSSAKKSNS